MVAFYTIVRLTTQFLGLLSLWSVDRYTNMIMHRIIYSMHVVWLESQIIMVPPYVGDPAYPRVPSVLVTHITSLVTIRFRR